MIDKKQMTEEEIKLNFITPAIERTWPKNCIRMEFPITKGRIILCRLPSILFRRQPEFPACRCRGEG